MGIEELIIEHFKQEGMEKGMEKGFKLSIQSMLYKGYEPKFVAEVLSVEFALVLKVLSDMKKSETRSNH
jgi:hypothetical protein